MPVDARIEKSTQLILKAGLELLNENKDAKLTDVAIKAGVGRATLYRLFKNKEDLVTAITQYCLEEYDKATSSIEAEAKSAMHALELLFHYAMPLTLEFKFLTNLEYFTEISPELREIELQQKNEMYELIDEVITEVNADSILTATWLYNFIEGLFYAGFLQQTEENNSAQHAAELAFHCFEKVIK